MAQFLETEVIDEAALATDIDTPPNARINRVVIVKMTQGGALRLASVDSAGTVKYANVAGAFVVFS